MPLLDDSEWSPVGNPVAQPRQPSGIFRRALGDTAIDAAKGVVGLGQAVVGLGDLATFGLLGDALKTINYDPERTQQWMGEGYSTQRQEAEAEVDQAEGFMGKMGALASNPSALIGRGIQSAPMMMGAMGAAGKAYQATNSLRAATAAGHAAEGALTAGSVAQDIRNQGGSRGDMYWAVPAGVATGAIGYGAGRLLPEGQIETLLIPGARAASMTGQPVGLTRRIATSAFSEGVLEEMPQSGSEQAFTNLGTGKPLMYRVPEAMGEGLAVGAATGGVLGGFRRNAPPAPTNLLPGANAGQQTQPPAQQQFTQPTLDPYAPVGQTGTLFGGQPDLTTPPAPQSEGYRDLLSDMIVLQRMAEQAQAAGDTDQLFAINEALQQLSSQMAAMGDNLNQKRLFDTGIYDMVGDQPYELTGDQAAAGGLPTLEGEMEPVAQDTRLAEIRAALTQANGGKANAQLLRFIPEFRAALAQGPDAIQAVLDKYDTEKSTLNGNVLETAAQLADIYRQQDIAGMAAEGRARAQPGVQVGQAPVSNATEMAMREQNQARDAQETATIEQMVQDDADLRALEGQIPERQEKTEQSGQRRLFSNQEMGRVIPNQTPAAATTAELDQSRQRKLIDSKGRPVTQPKAKQPAPAPEPTPAPTPAPAPAPTPAPTPEPAAAAAPTPAPAPKKPRKAKVTMKVGDQDVELDVENADARIAEMQKDIDKYEAFVACLRKK